MGDQVSLYHPLPYNPDTPHIGVEEYSTKPRLQALAAPVEKRRTESS